MNSQARKKGQKILDILEVKKELGLIKAQNNPFLDLLLKVSGLEDALPEAERKYLNE